MRAGQWTGFDCTDRQALVLCTGGDGRDRLLAMRRVAHDAAGAETLTANLELRLDHDEQVGTGTDARRQDRKDERQRDEGEIGDDEVDRSRKRARVKVAKVDALPRCDPGIGPERWEQLAVPDVDRKNVACTAPQKHIGEATRRRTGVEAGAPFDSRPFRTEPIEHTGELVTGPRREIGQIRPVLDRDLLIGPDRGGRLGDGLLIYGDPAGDDQIGGLAA